MIWQGFLDPELSLRLCLTLLHSLWQVAVFAAAAWGASRLWRNRSVERDYVFYSAALLASLIAMPVTFAFTSTGAPRNELRLSSRRLQCQRKLL